MEMLEGLDDRALAIDGNNLQILRWGAEQNGFGAVITNIWLSLERQSEAEAFAAAVDAARKALG